MNLSCRQTYMTSEIPKRTWPGTLTLSAQIGLGFVLVMLAVITVRFPAAWRGDGLALLWVVLIGLSFFEALAFFAFQHRKGWPARALVTGAQGGLVLGIFEIINISLEDFAGLPPGLQAALGVSMWGLMFLLFGAAGSRATDRSHSLAEGAAAGLWTAVVGTIITLLYGFALPLLAMPELIKAVNPGAVDPQTQAVFNTLSGASMHLILAPILAVAFALGGGASALITRRFPRTIRLVLAAALLMILMAGIAGLVWANGLPRAERPPFVMGGLAALGLSLAVSHAILSNAWASEPLAAAEILPPRSA